MKPVQTPVPLALVHHGHQYLITDGYDNREGISEVLDGFGAVLALHLKYRVPANIHLSGTLIEAISWHAPGFFSWVQALREEGLLELIGSTYAQNIMVLFSEEHNIRQMNEALSLYERHLGIPPEEVRGFWVPERVWNTERLAPLIHSPRLLNGGYDYVLLDDRLAYPVVGADGRDERWAFDSRSAPVRALTGRVAPITASDTEDAPHLRPLEVQDGYGLAMIPISSDLRYSVPPRNEESKRALRDVLGAVAAAGEGTIAVYADDLEKTAVLGPWRSGAWDRRDLEGYDEMLEWVSTDTEVDTTLLSVWLDRHPPREVRRVDPGTFFELAHEMGAGEDYLGWWDARAWRPYRQALAEVEAILVDAGPRPRGGLWDLAWKQLMACSYETGWHAFGDDGHCRPAHWARAIASHVRAVFATIEAARWQDGTRDALRASVTDIDGDGEDELVIASGQLFAVISPERGGRIVQLFDLTAPHGRLVVGNPNDDWNWQEEVNRYMETPRNHPGAFADRRYENDRYEVTLLQRDEAGVEAHILNVQEGSPLRGTVKEFRLEAGACWVDVAYRLAHAPERFEMEMALSPDYLSLLREGRWRLSHLRGASATGWRFGDTAVWVQVPNHEPVLLDVAVGEGCGHAGLVRAVAYRPRFRLRLGVGAVPAADEIWIADQQSVAKGA